MKLPRVILLALVVLLEALEVGAQSDAPTLREACFAFLEAESGAALRDARAALLRQDDLTLSRVVEALDQGPLRAGYEGGATSAVPFTIPRTKIETTYELFVPKAAPPPEGFPLWIGIHGTGGTGAGIFGTLVQALSDRGAMIVCPTEAPDIRAEGWGFRDRERQLHVGLIDHLARRYPVDRSRVFVMGWSRGGHGSWDLPARFPDRFAGAGPIIGAPLMRDRALLVNFSTVKVFAVNGERDQEGLVAGAKAGVARLSELGFSIKSIMDSARGHDFFSDRLPELVENLSTSRRDLLPRDYTFATADLLYDRRSTIRITAFGKDAYRQGKPMVIEGSSKMTEEERRAAYLQKVRELTPSVRVQFEHGVFTLTGRHVKSADLFIPLSFVEESPPLTIVANGKTLKKGMKVAPPKPLALLELTREFGGADAGYRFAAKVRVTFP